MAVLKIRNELDTEWIELGGRQTIIQQDAAPADPYAGMMWLDTDEDLDFLSTLRDKDGDTKIQCEEGADEDYIRFDCDGHQLVVMTDDLFVIYGKEETAASMILAADLATDNADYWKLNAGIAGNFSLQSFATGAYTSRIIAYEDGDISFPLQSAFRATTESGQTGMSSGSTLKCQYDSEEYDVGSDYDAVTNFRYTCPEDGRYAVSAIWAYAVSTSWSWDSEYNQWLMYIRVNGSAIAERHHYYAQNAQSRTMQSSIDMILDLDANDYIEIWVYQGSSATHIGFNGDACSFSVSKVA
jgi:hypothetical protein